MADEQDKSRPADAPDTEDVSEAMGEATGDTLKAPAGVEDEQANKDRPEGTEDPPR